MEGCGAGLDGDADDLVVHARFESIGKSNNIVVRLVFSKISIYLLSLFILGIV